MSEIQDLIAISQFYGKDKRYVIAGGGNTSYKNAEKLWVKASGSALATITEDGFAVLDRSKLQVLSTRQYSANTAEREEQVKNDLAAACITKGRRPSVETSMHNIIDYAFVVHLHPTAVNGLMCSQKAEQQLHALFGEKALYVPYTDPGYTLFKKVEEGIQAHRARFNEEPSVIWLQNHGIFVAANTIAEIRKIYDEILSKLSGKELEITDRPTCECVEKVVPALRMMLCRQAIRQAGCQCQGIRNPYAGANLKVLKVRKNSLVKSFYDSAEAYAKIARPFTPDGIVYAKSNYIYIDAEEPEAMIAQAEKAIPAFVDKFGYLPKVLLVKGIGIVAVGDNAAQ